MTERPHRPFFFPGHFSLLSGQSAPICQTGVISHLLPTPTTLAFRLVRMRISSLGSFDTNGSTEHLAQLPVVHAANADSKSQPL
jgi:hypothetical protein